MKKKPNLVIKIKDIDWTFIVQSDATFKKGHGKDGKNAEAITYTHNRTIYFNSVYLSPYSVRHELLHAFVGSTNTGSMAKMSGDDIEELIADIIGEHHDDISALTTKILNHFLR